MAKIGLQELYIESPDGLTYKPYEVRLVLEEWATTTGDIPVLSSDCITYRELEMEINMLKKELDDALDRAGVFLSKE